MIGKKVRIRGGKEGVYLEAGYVRSDKHYVQVGQDVVVLSTDEFELIEPQSYTHPNGITVGHDEGTGAALILTYNDNACDYIPSKEAEALEGYFAHRAGQAAAE